MAENKTIIDELSHHDKITPPISGSGFINVGKTERILSVLGGAYFAFKGLTKFTPLGIIQSVVGGTLLYRGITGHCPINEAIGRNTSERVGVAIEFTETITINRARKDVFASWRRFENFPVFMKHLKQVRQTSDKQFHWVAEFSDKLSSLQWDAEITEEEQDVRIAWRSLPGSGINNAGEVLFTDAPGNRGTELHITIFYRPPVGDLGGLVASMLTPYIKEIIGRDVKQFKQYLEAGEVATISGQASGRNRMDLEKELKHRIN